MRFLLPAALALLTLGAATLHASAAVGDPCGREGQVQCTAVTRVSPSLLTVGEIDTTTVQGAGLDGVTSVRLEPVDKPLRFTASDPATMVVSLPNNLAEGNYTLALVGRGAPVETSTIAVVSPSAPPADTVPVATPPPPKAAAAASPSTAAAVAPPVVKPAKPAPPQASWLLTILAGVIAGSVATIYLGVRWRLAKRKRLEEMDEALLRMWALDKDTTTAKPRSRA